MPRNQLGAPAKVHREDWGTPYPLYLACHREMEFDFDAAASEENALHEDFLSIEDDALAMTTWRRMGERCWLNPPYGRGIGAWVQKAAEEARAMEPLTVITMALLPVSTDTRWWHEWVFDEARAIWFLKGRLRFRGTGDKPAPFASALVLYAARSVEVPLIDWPAMMVEGPGASR